MVLYCVRLFLITSLVAPVVEAVVTQQHLEHWAHIYTQGQDVAPNATGACESLANQDWVLLMAGLPHLDVPQLGHLLNDPEVVTTTSATISPGMTAATATPAPTPPAPPMDGVPARGAGRPAKYGTEAEKRTAKTARQRESRAEKAEAQKRVRLGTYAGLDAHFRGGAQGPQVMRTVEVAETGEVLYCFDTAGTATQGNCGVHALLGTSPGKQYEAAAPRPTLVAALVAARTANGVEWARAKKALAQEVVHLFHVHATGDGSLVEQSSAKLLLKQLPDAATFLAHIAALDRAVADANRAVNHAREDAVMNDPLVADRLRQTLLDPANSHIGPTVRARAAQVGWPTAADVRDSFLEIGGDTLLHLLPPAARDAVMRAQAEERRHWNARTAVFSAFCDEDARWQQYLDALRDETYYLSALEVLALAAVTNTHAEVFIDAELGGRATVVRRLDNPAQAHAGVGGVGEPVRVVGLGAHYERAYTLPEAHRLHPQAMQAWLARRGATRGGGGPPAKGASMGAFDLWSQVDPEAESQFTGPTVTYAEVVDRQALEAWLRGGRDLREGMGWALLEQATKSATSKVLVVRYSGPLAGTLSGSTL